ncbi:UNVERIFIED_CONTAM: hypothetical protein FKN15_054764 [Acipenser sinensis]
MLRRSVLGARRRRSVRGARRTHLDASTFVVSALDAWCLVHQRYTHLSVRRSMLGIVKSFHRCVTCQVKLPASDPHEDCVACLGPEHAASALADRTYCALCAGFQTRTFLGVIPHCLGPAIIHGDSASQAAAFQKPILPAHSWELHRRESRSRSRSLCRKGRSHSPREDRQYRGRSGVPELTSKSQFMEVMMGQQSLLMSLANVAPSHQLPGPTSQPVALPQPIPVPVPQLQEWDVDAVSRDASDGELLLEEDSAEAELTSQPSEQEVEPELMHTNDPMWALVERVSRHLGVEWPLVEQPRCSLFESPSAQPLQSRMLPAFPDFIKEVQSTWGTPASAPATSRKASAFNMQGATEAGLASFPPVDTAFAALVKTLTLSGLTKDPACPNKQCRITEVHLKKGYSAATEAVRLSNVASLLTVYQAALIKDLPECLSMALRAELGMVNQLLETRGVLKVFLENVIRDAVTYTEHAKRKTVTGMDVVYALKRQGRTLYGFGG